MTELNDHLKLLFARAAQLYCRGCGTPVRRDTPDSIADALLQGGAAGAPRALVTFAVAVPENFSEQEVEALLAQQGYTRIHAREGKTLEVIQDRVRLAGENRARLVESAGGGPSARPRRVAVYPLDDAGEAQQARRFSTESALRRLRSPLPRTRPQSFLVQFADRRLRHLPGFRPDAWASTTAWWSPTRARRWRRGRVKPWQTEATANARAT